MKELKFDQSVPELTAEEEAATLAAIEQGIAQLDAGQGIPVEDLRAELVRQCSE